MGERIAYKSGYKYQLAETYKIATGIKPEYAICTPYIMLDLDGALVIKKGYAWDGASGALTVDTKTFMRGSLVHDALYQLLREGHLLASQRAQADKLLHDICLQDGMSKLRAWYVYKAVCIFGGMANTERPLQYAPS